MIVALSVTDCGLPAALSVMTRLVVAVAMKVFAKTPVRIVQLFPAPNVPGQDEIQGSQLVISPKSPGAVPPETLMLVILIAVFPVLVSVMGFAASWSKYMVPKFTAVVDIVSAETVADTQALLEVDPVASVVSPAGQAVSVA